MSNVLAEQATRSSETGVGPADERPLSDAERKVVTRLLSDPFAFPQSFKTWLISFLEGSDLSLPLGAVNGLLNAFGNASGGAGIFGMLPAGMLFPFAGINPPSGTFLCQGQAVSRTTYARLFKEIGTRYGIGDGTNTFNLPDYQKRALVGFGLDYAVGANEGLPVTQRGMRHHHGLNNHSHGMSHTHTLNGHTHTVNLNTDSVGDHQHYTSGYLHGAPAGSTQVGLQTGSPTGNTALSTGGGAHNHGVAGQTGGSNASTSGPNFTTTSGSADDTTGGGPADTPSWMACAVIINY